MLPWTLKLNCKPYITYALLVYDLFSVEETARVLKLVVEHWSFASCSHSSMFIKPVLVLNSVVHSVSRVYETCFSLLSLSLRSWRRNFWRLEYGYHWRDSALRGLLQLVHLAVTGWVSQLKAPALILVYKTGRVMELTQSLQGLDVLLFWCPASLLRSWQIPSFLLEAWSYSRQGAST